MRLRPCKCFGVGRHKAKSGRHHQTFLGAAQTHINTQSIHVKGRCPKGGHHIHHKKRWVTCAVDGFANGLQIACDAAGCVGVNHHDGRNVVSGVRAQCGFYGRNINWLTFGVRCSDNG